MGTKGVLLCPDPVPWALRRAQRMHRHGGISLSPAPWWALGIISSLGGCETRQPRWNPVKPVR